MAGRRTRSMIDAATAKRMKKKNYIFESHMSVGDTRDTYRQWIGLYAIVIVSILFSRPFEYKNIIRKNCATITVRNIFWTSRDKKLQTRRCFRKLYGPFVLFELTGVRYILRLYIGRRSQRVRRLKRTRDGRIVARFKRKLGNTNYYKFRVYPTTGFNQSKRAVTTNLTRLSIYERRKKFVFN